MTRILSATVVITAMFLFCQADCKAQITLQLPTIGFFNVRTVVSVPDGGSMHMGGIKRYATGQTSRGVPGLNNIPGAGRLFGNRAIGSDAGASTASVHAKIIIMSEIEKEVLAEAARRAALRAQTDPNGSQNVQRKADFISRNIGKKRK